MTENLKLKIGMTLLVIANEPKLHFAAINLNNLHHQNPCDIRNISSHHSISIELHVVARVHSHQGGTDMHIR